ncbi:MAG: hypothetical protein ACRD63_02640 [Pyrinomonadaceae bacterium]
MFRAFTFLSAIILAVALYGLPVHAASELSCPMAEMDCCILAQASEHQAATAIVDAAWLCCLAQCTQPSAIPSVAEIRPPNIVTTSSNPIQQESEISFANRSSQ